VSKTIKQKKQSDGCGGFVSGAAVLENKYFMYFFQISRTAFLRFFN